MAAGVEEHVTASLKEAVITQTTSWNEPPPTTMLLPSKLLKCSGHGH